MKRILLATLLCAVAVPASADVSASITIGEPNFYGVINIGDVPEPPRLIYREPMVIERVTVVHEPVYMRVPPGHAKDWGKHCHKYQSCGRPVYFVEDDWYEHKYVPHHKAKHGKGGKHHDHDRHDGGHHDGGHGKSKGGKGHKGGKGKGGKD